jgi:hypothetical protein
VPEGWRISATRVSDSSSWPLLSFLSIFCLFSDVILSRRHVCKFALLMIEMPTFAGSFKKKAEDNDYE